MTVKQLKDILSEKGAKRAGRKQDLVERLEAYDRNYNFGNVISGPTPAWTRTCPVDTSFKDITSTPKVPKVNRDSLKAHLPRFDWEIWFQILRFQCTVIDTWDSWGCQSRTHFIRGLVNAMMKKSVSYCFNINLTSNGVIMAAQCECGAGVGPDAHCKHVQVLALA